MFMGRGELGEQPLPIGGKTTRGKYELTHHKTITFKCVFFNIQLMLFINYL